MVFTSIYPEVEVPAGADLWSFIIENPSREYRDNHPLFVQTETGESLNFIQIQTAAKQFGAAIKKEWGWSEGDVLGLLAPSLIEIPILVLGTFWANGVVTIINPAATKEQLKYQLKDSGAKGVIVVPDLLELAVEVAAELNISTSHILLFGKNGKERFPTWTDFSIKSITDDELSTATRIPLKNGPEASLATLPYTSGTTGVSKGVRLTHSNIIHNVVQFSKLEASGDAAWSWEKDSLLSVLPWFHQYGIFTMIAVALYSGLTIYVLEKFDFPKMLMAIPKYKITYLTIVPPIFAAIAVHPVIDAFDLSSLRLLYSAGSFLESRIADAVMNRLTAKGGKPMIRQGYGMTEACPVITTQTNQDHLETKGTCGYLLPGNEIKLVEIHTGAEITTPNTLGRVLVRGPNIFKGYHNLPDLNASLFGPDGFFDTGDLAVVNKAGAFTIKGRVAEAVKIKSKRLLILPGEIEEALAAHPAVADGCVAAVDGEVPGDQVARAFVVVKNGVDKTSELQNQIHAFVAEKLTEKEKHLHGGVKFVEAIPKTPAGKILRRLLVDVVA